MLRNKSILILCFLAASCGFKIQNETSCEELYKKKELQDCYNCSKKHLVSNPTDLSKIQLIAECAQTQDELAFVKKLMLKNRKDFLTSPGYLISFSDVCLKLGDTTYANKFLSQVEQMYNNRIPSTIIVNGRDRTIVSPPDYYKYAVEYWNQYNDVEKDGKFIPIKQKTMDLTYIINYLNKELEHNPNNSAALTLRNQVEDILSQLL